MKSARYLFFAMLLVVMASAMVTTAYAAQSDDAGFAPAPYYGREALSKLDNKDALLYAYDQIVAGVEISAEEIAVVKDDFAISLKEIEMVFDAYVRDHTEHFWLGNSYGRSYNSATVLTIQPSYILSGSELEAAKEEFELAVTDMLSGITNTMSEFDRELVLHDRLAAAVSYTSSTHAHNAYGALVEGYAVCEGYAEALQYLLQRVGIQAFLVQGAGINPVSQTQEAHEWNAVCIDGNFYHVDLTWDDQGENLYHAYFNLPTETMEEDHVIGGTNYELPICNSDAANYFEVKGGKLITYDVDSICTILKNNNFVANVYLPEDDEPDRFLTWIQENIYELAAGTGISGSFSYSYAALSREVKFNILPKNLNRVVVELSATSTGRVGGTVTVNYYALPCNLVLTAYDVDGRMLAIKFIENCQAGTNMNFDLYFSGTAQTVKAFVLSDTYTPLILSGEDSLN